MFRHTALLLCLFGSPVVAQTTVLHPLANCCGFGWAIAPLADTDADGVQDLAIGANTNGRLLVYSGKTGANRFAVSLPGTNLGYSVADAGDVNADGTTDVIGGAPSSTGGGNARVYSGRDGAELLNLSAAGSSASDFGSAVAGLGDVNGDGHSDVLVTAAGGSGEARVLSGSDGAVLYVVAAPTAATGFGAGAGRLHDLNADGIDDFAVGAPRDGVGKVFVYSGRNGALLFSAGGDVGGGEFGTFFVSDAGDTDGDGKHDIFVGDYAAVGGNGAAYVFSGATGTRLHKFTGSGAEGLGTGRGAGDVDGDGRADLVIGAGTYSSAGVANGGRVLVYSGRDASVLATYVGTRAAGNFGFDATPLGDTDGDGRIDFGISSASINRVDIVAGTTPRTTQGFAIASGISGNWYDPAQNGHGIQFEVLSPSVMTAFWFTFDNAGNEVWIAGAGTIEGDHVVMQANRSAGGRFPPNFNPAAITNRPWGTLRFTFTDCSTGRVEWTATDPAFTASGSMPLKRLTQVLDTRCQ